MNLFLYGAPCRELYITQQLLTARGYTVRSLSDLLIGQTYRIIPRDTKRMRATEMLMCDAVIIEDELPLKERNECIMLCKALGVPALLLSDLDAVLTDARNTQEYIDSMDRTASSPMPISTQRSHGMSLIMKADRLLAPWLTNGAKRHRLNRYR